MHIILKQNPNESTDSLSSTISGRSLNVQTHSRNEPFLLTVFLNLNVLSTEMNQEEILNDLIGHVNLLSPIELRVSVQSVQFLYDELLVVFLHC